MSYQNTKIMLEVQPPKCAKSLQVKTRLTDLLLVLSKLSTYQQFSICFFSQFSLALTDNPVLFFFPSFGTFFLFTTLTFYFVVSCTFCETYFSSCFFCFCFVFLFFSCHFKLLTTITYLQETFSSPSIR